MYGKVEICGVNTAKLKVLPNHEIVSLLEKTKEGDLQAREALISGNLRLVLSVIQRFINRGEMIDDLFQVGCVGLIKAIDNFDLSHMVKFSTYAVPMNVIRRNIKRKVLHMTRKQAVCRALALFETMERTSENQEITTKLKEVIDEMPFTAWSEETIRDTMRQFAVENERNPNVTDLKRAGMPSHTVIKNRFGIPAGEFLNTYYPSAGREFNSKIYGHKSKEEWTENFKEQVLDIKPRSGSDYDLMRDRNTPCWFTVAKYNGVSCWTGLLKHLGLPQCERTQARMRIRRKLNVTSEVKILSAYEELSTQAEASLRELDCLVHKGTDYSG